MNTFAISPLTWLTLAQDITNANAISHDSNKTDLSNHDANVANTILQQSEDNRVAFVQNVLTSFKQLGLDISGINAADITKDKQIQNKTTEAVNSFIYQLYQLVSKRSDLPQITTINNSPKVEGFILSNSAVMHEGQSISIISVISLFAQDPAESNSLMNTIANNGVTIQVLVPPTDANAASQNTTGDKRPDQTDKTSLADGPSSVAADTNQVNQTDAVNTDSSSILPTESSSILPTELSPVESQTPDNAAITNTDTPALNQMIDRNQYNDFNSNLHNLISLLNNNQEVGSTLQSNFTALVEILGGKNVSLQDFLIQMASNTQNDSSLSNNLGAFFQALA